MYHIAHIAPNQEESEALKNIRSVITMGGGQVTVVRADDVQSIKKVFKLHYYNLICISCNYKPHQLFPRVEAALEECKSKQRIIPLVYLLNWKNPLPSMLGTGWGNFVGIVHNFSSRSEIMSMFIRFAELYESAEKNRNQ